MNLIPYTGDRSAMQGSAEGVAALTRGVERASSALADSISKEYAQNQAKKDELDAFLGMGQYLSDSGQISPEDLQAISSMPVAKAKGHMTAMVADLTRKKAQDDALALQAARHKDNSLNPEDVQAREVPGLPGTFAVPTSKGAVQLVTPGRGQKDPNEVVPYYDPQTGEYLGDLPANSKFIPGQDATAAMTPEARAKGGIQSRTDAWKKNMNQPPQAPGLTINAPVPDAGVGGGEMSGGMPGLPKTVNVGAVPVRAGVTLPGGVTVGGGQPSAAVRGAAPAAAASVKDGQTKIGKDGNPYIRQGGVWLRAK